MTQSVSPRSIWMIASAITMSILWIAFVLPVTGVVPGGLLGLMTLATALWVGTRSTRSFHTEPAPVPVVPSKSVL